MLKILNITTYGFLVTSIPKLEINETQSNKIKFGNAYTLNTLNSNTKETVRMYHHGVFLGIAHIDGYKLQPERLVCFNN